MTYNTLVYARIIETGDIRMVLAVDPHFEGNGKAYCLKMTDEDISKGLQPTEWFNANLVTLVDQEKPSIANICTSAGDKAIDEWLDQQETFHNLPSTVVLPYTCISCQKPLAFPHTFFLDGLTYCSDCLPSYDKHQQW